MPGVEGPCGRTQRSLLTLPSILPGVWDCVQGRQGPRVWLAEAQQGQRAIVGLAELFKRWSQGPVQDHHAGGSEP